MASNIFAMPSSVSLLLVAAAFSLTSALPWSGPQKTARYAADEWTPRPTSLPANPARLFKRQAVAVNICGWVDGDFGAPAGCASGSSCVHDTIHGYIGCCTTSGACTEGVYTSCVDSNSAGWSPNYGVQENGVYTCQEEDVCFRNTYPAGYYQYGCGPSSTTVSVATTYAGQPSNAFIQLVYTGVSYFYGADQQYISADSSVAPASSLISVASNTIASVTQSVTSEITLSFSTASSAISSASTASPTAFSTFSSQSSTVSSQSSNPSSQTSSSSISSTPTSSSTLTSTPSTTHRIAAAATTTTAAPSAPLKGWSGTIAGATLGAVAFAGLLIVLILFLRRRHQRRAASRRAPPFKSILKNSNPPSRGPFQRLRPYDPVDGFAPGEVTQLRGGGLSDDAADSLLSSNYRGVETPGRTYLASSTHSHSRSISREETPLITEIDDFSRSFSAAMRQVSGEALGPGSGFGLSGRGAQTPPDTVTGLGHGVGAPLPRRTSSQGSDSNTSQYSSPSPEIPLRSPRRLTPSPRRLEEALANVAAGNVGGSRGVDDGRTRYQLVDPGAVSDDVPILRSPGQLRTERAVRAKEGKE